MRLSLAGSNENLLAEVPDLHWTTPNGEHYLRGGHRLWHAPEAAPRSSVPDNDGLTIEERDGARGITHIELASELPSHHLWRQD